MTFWLCIAGHKPLAHLPRWKRRLFHLPSVRWRLWPRPWNFNGPVVGYRQGLADVRDSRMRLWNVIHDLIVELPETQRETWAKRAEEAI